MQFVDGLKGAGPEFTQQKVINYLNAKGVLGRRFDPAGQLDDGHIDPQKHPEVRLEEQCMPVMQIKGGKFVLFDTPPAKPFTCRDTAKSADQPAVYRSFAPGGSG